MQFPALVDSPEQTPDKQDGNHHWGTDLSLFMYHQPEPADNFQQSAKTMSDLKTRSHCLWSLKGQGQGNVLHLQGEQGRLSRVKLKTTLNNYQ